MCPLLTQWHLTQNQTTVFWWIRLLVSNLATRCQNATLVDESARLESGEEDSPVLVDDRGMCKFQWEADNSRILHWKVGNYFYRFRQQRFYLILPGCVLVRLSNILGSLQLDLEPLGAHLVTVHRLDCRMCCLVGGEGDKSCLMELV